MKTRKGILILLLSVAIILAITQSAMAGRGKEVAGGGFLDSIVNKSAPGTKISGPIAIYYEKGGTASCTGMGDFSTNMYFFMRLRKGNNLYPFSGVTKNVCYFDVNTQASAVGSFIQNTVIPVIYRLPSGRTYPFALKNVDQLIEDDEADFGGCCGGDFHTIYFTIADIEIAVQD